ncbi:hypothetical protein K461DRAFT_321906 [Myriangium duriaei CBS 260.36]|uniref:Uncharacterized protein n=1 Tax=Myriangium duriaei CBS 260.36 TaxID=1168546 RepID=A0A9P4MEX6_9PEZI|nr:hypothetical protein K461DRAFT_321906 [Myriangium duriaei CBS 260.36]
METTPITIDVSDPSSGSKANRQAKKLQLRKAGFKARDMPARNITPRRNESWSRSNISASWGSKVAPLMDVDSVSEIQAPSSVLREINNSTRRRKKQTRPRVDDTVFVYQDENSIASPKVSNYADIDSRLEDSPRCGTPGSPAKTRSPNKGTPSNRLRRQSVSIDTVKYIEHLEAELAAAQTQLSSMNSPTVLQARSLKMRTLNAETRALQDEVSEWERRFHERVQEEIEERTKIESALKSRIRLMEGDVNDYMQKIQDLQTQLEKSKDNITAAESANIELERRIDAISGLVASPKRGGRERSNSAARKRHARQRSMLPRFPTSGSISLKLPSRVQEEADAPTTPTTLLPDPMASAGAEKRGGLRSPNLAINKEALDALTGADGTPLVTPAEKDPGSSGSKHFSWATPECYTSLESVAAASTGKPSRRMRRFHAGTVMPKPLLLPSTTSCAYASPASAPVLQKEETPPSFPFPELSHLAGMPITRNFDCLLSPMPGNGRRRALTCIEDVAAAMRRASNPFLSPMPYPAAMATSASRPSTSSSAVTDSDCTVVEDLSSLGPPPVGRNLFDELQRVRETDTTDIDSFSFQPCESVHTTEAERPSTAGSNRSPSYGSTARCVGLRKRAWTCHHRTFSDQTGLLALRSAVDERDEDGNAGDDEGDHGFFALVADVFRQTYDTARQCLMYAQSITIRSATVQRLQWWLVQVFLGPMATRRMMATSMRQGRRQRRTRHIEALSGAPPTRRSYSQRHALGPNIWIDGINGRELQVARPRPHYYGMVELPMNWIQKHSPWLWIRFSLALLFAIGAAIRDGPSVVMGLQEEEDKIE